MRTAARWILWRLPFALRCWALRRFSGWLYPGDPRDPVYITEELLEDAGVNMANILADVLGGRSRTVRVMPRALPGEPEGSRLA